jgi:hypothetical protein
VACTQPIAVGTVFVWLELLPPYVLDELDEFEDAYGDGVGGELE